QSDDCDLLGLIDAKGKITALRTRSSELSTNANRAIHSLLQSSGGQEWWVSDTRLYQVVVKPYYQDAPANHILLGKAVVGREFDDARATDLARILSGQVLFQYGDKVLVGSFFPFQERELVRQLTAAPRLGQPQLGKQRFFASSINLTPGSSP